MHSLDVSLAALYLRGAPRPVEVRRAGWPNAARAVRRSACDLAAIGKVLRDAGLWAEALVAESPGLLAWAEREVEARRVLTAASPVYPCRWIRILGASAPPALWRAGEPPTLPSLSIVGSRAISRSVERFCAEVAREAVRLGFCIFSGGARGCDRAAARGGGPAVVEVMPFGLPLAEDEPRGCRVSVCAPDEPFSTGTAMERNALIYAASAYAVIGAARFKDGGTWHGAVDAARRRLSYLLVRSSEELAMRALASLGGSWLGAPADLAAAVRAPGRQAELFESAV